MNNTIKICKKHGPIEEKDTYILKNYKNENPIRMCLICKKGYKNDWGKLNTDKVKESQLKMRNKRLKELENGTLEKICNVHGNLLIEKIRIDARGTLVCKLCANEQAYKSHSNPDYKKRRREWYHSDVERKKRYAENYKPKRRIRQRRRYHEIKVENPEKHKKIEKIKLECAKKARARLDDYYVASLLKTIRYRGRKNRFYKYLSGADIPKEFIEEVKELLKIKRKIKQLRKSI